MIYVKVPVNDGIPDLDFSNPPIEQIQLSNIERYCSFADEVEIKPAWTVITKEEFNSVKPVIPTSPPKITLEEKVDALGIMMTQILLK